MSGILKLLKKKTIKLGIILFGVGIFFFALRLYIFSALFCLLLIGYISIFTLSILVRKKLNNVAEYFTPKGKMRNVDSLVIGDMYRYSCDGTSVQICAPNRGIKSCYEILRHTHSILKENGSVVVAVKKSCINNDFTPFDTPYFHYISVNRLHLEGIKSKERLIAYYYPLMALKYAFDIKTRKYDLNRDFISVIDEFCKQRGYNLEYRIK